MKAVAVLVVLAVLLAVAGTLAFRVAAFERDMAAVEEDLSTQRYGDAATALSRASEALGWTGWMPRFGVRAHADINTRQAELRYWQQQYKELMPREADPV